MATVNTFVRVVTGILLLVVSGMVQYAAAQSWIQLAPAGGSPPVKFFGASVVYDSSNNRLILFGGNNGSSTTNDVWVLTNANGLGGTPTWTQLAPTGGPPAPRDNHAAVYDSANNRMIIFGGCEGGCLPALNDVWVLTNANGLHCFGGHEDLHYKLDRQCWERVITIGFLQRRLRGLPAV